MERLKQAWANIESWFGNLTSRERRLVVLAGSAATIFVLFIIVFGLSSSAAAIQRRTAEKLQKLQAVQTLAAVYRESELRRQNVERQLSSNNIQLISFLEEKSTAAGLQIQTMTPKGDAPVGDGKIVETSVELSLTDIPLNKLVNFLNSVEQGGMVKVKYLRLEPRTSTNTLTAWTNIAAYRLK